MDIRTTLGLLLGLAGCTTARQSPHADWVPAAAPDLGDPVARIGGVAIFAKQVLAHARRNEETARQALASLVDESLMAESARSVGRQLPSIDDPDVKSALVERLLEREVEPGLEVTAMPDSVLRPLYQRAHDSFVHPRLVEIGVLAVYTGDRMKEGPRQERAATATELAAFVAKHPPVSLDDFIAIAHDSQWSERDVVYNRVWQGLDKPFSKVVGNQVAKLRAQGQTTSLLSDETGFFIARYIDERPPENISFEQARPKIVAAYFEHWRQEQFLSSTAKLMQEHSIAAHFDRIAGDEQGR